MEHTFSLNTVHLEDGVGMLMSEVNSKRLCIVPLKGTEILQQAVSEMYKVTEHNTYIGYVFFGGQRTSNSEMLCT